MVCPVGAASVGLPGLFLGLPILAHLGLPTLTHHEQSLHRLHLADLGLPTLVNPG